MRLRSPSRRLAKPAVLLLLASIATSALAATEDELNSAWRGAWVITGVGASSDCGGNYTNNEVRGQLVSGKGEHQLDSGELARVYKVNLQRKKVEVLVDVAEPLLVPHRDGPFTLYDEVHCRVEYQLPLAARSGRDAAALDTLLESILERHASRAAALDSPTWNGRQRRPYPADYEQTLAEHSRWRIDQVNGAVAAQIEESVETAARLVDRVEEDPEYLAGLAAGIDAAQSQSLGKDCDRLLSYSPSRFVDRAAKGSSAEFREGFEEGQKLVFHLELARRLHGCFLPPPL